MKKEHWHNKAKSDWDFVYARSIRMGFVEELADHIATIVVERAYYPQMHSVKDEHRAGKHDDGRGRQHQEDVVVPQPDPRPIPYKPPTEISYLPPGGLPDPVT